MYEWLQVVDLSPTEGELRLYGEIVSEQPWYDSNGEYIVPAVVRRELNRLKDKSKITIRINSNGGDVFAAQALLTELRLFNAEIEVIVDGLAASAATILMMAGKVKAAANANFMFHLPAVMGYMRLTEDDLPVLGNMLSTVKQSIIEAYKAKATVSEEELNKLLKATTWMTAKQAKEKGFVDEILFENKASYEGIKNSNFVFVNSVPFDLSRFKDMPYMSKPEEKPQNKPLPQNKPEESDEVIKNAEELKEKYPDIYNSIIDSTKKAEQERLSAIDKIADNIDPELVAKAKQEGKTAQELALNAFESMATSGKSFFKNMVEDNEKSGADGVEGSQTSPPIEDKPLTLVNKGQNILNKKYSGGVK